MRQNYLLIALLFVLSITGCSGRENPMTPDSENQKDNDFGIMNDLPIIAATTSDDGSVNGLGVLGAFELRLDPSTLTADLVSKRTSSIGESWIVSGVGFFTISPCTDCLQVQKIALTSENYLQLTFSIQHPFEPGNTAEPPTWKNRLDLDVFDVALVIAPAGAATTNYPLTGANAYTGILVNNAGYTTELANITGDLTALPYVLVIDDNLSGTSTNNKFYMGMATAFDAQFDLETVTSFVFDMYLTMGYGWSAKKPQRLSPTYYIPEFNRKSAWKVKVTPPNGSDSPGMTNTWNDMDSSTLWNVTIEVFDWQIGSHVDPALANTTDIYAASDVARVSVEIPGMNSTLPSMVAPVSGTGTPTDPLVYIISIANQNLLDDGEYFGLVKVMDQRVPPNPIADRDYVIDVPDGVVLNNYAIPEYATYQTFPATVVVYNEPPVAIAIAATSTNILDGQTVTFDASASYDPDGMVVQYEWDFNEDGIFDGAGDEYTGVSWNPTHMFNLGDGSWNVQLKVTDNLLGQDQLDTPIVVTVGISKNKHPRPGFTIADMAAIKSTGDVLIMFNDNQVWKYERTITTGSVLYTMPGSMINQRLEACANGDSICGWFTTTSRDTYSYSSTGTLLTTHGFTTYVPRNLEVLALHAGLYNNYQAELGGYVSGGWVSLNRYAPPSYATSGISYDTSPGTGVNNLDMTYVKGAHASNTAPHIWVCEGAPEYRIEKVTHNLVYLGGGWGGLFGDGNNQFNNPLDVTSDIVDNVFVLDILSTGVRKIKKFSNAGTPYGSFGDNSSMGYVPTRVEASFANDWLYVAMGEYLSIFFPSEQP